MKDKVSVLKAIEELNKLRNYYYDKAYLESRPASTLYFKEVEKLDAKLSALEWVIA